MRVASETGADLFEVKYFKKKAYLAQSPQFYKQMAIAGGLDKVFEQGPVFRAEESHTSKHLTEFVSFDVEMAFIDDYEDIMELQEKWLVFVFKQVKKKHGKEIKEHFGIEITIPKTPFPRITMKEAHEKISELEVIDEFGDLDTEGEKKLGEYVRNEFNSDFVFLTDFPYNARPFYHMKKDNKFTMSYDLIYKGLELATAAQREHRYDKLIAQAKEKEIDEIENKFYLQMFKYGVPPHGGFGFGPERFVMQMLNINNIREVVFLPRDPDRLTP
jgi:aspartyl-tRNA synthetase